MAVRALLAGDDDTQTAGSGIHAHDAGDGAHGVELLEGRLLCVLTLRDTKDEPATLASCLQGSDARPGGPRRAEP